MDEAEKSRSVSGGGERWNSFLYVCVISANISSFSVGTAFAWSSPAIPKLNGLSDGGANNPLGAKLTPEEESWLASLLTLGAVVGPLFSAVLVDRIGRKKTLILSAFPMIACFTVKTFCTRLALFYLARFLGGISSGIVLTVVPMYVGEIAEVHNRGRSGCLLAIFISLGQLFGFSLGPYVHVQIFSMCCVVAPVVFLVVFTSLAPESPHHLFRAGKQKEAMRELLRLRNGDVAKTEKELAEIAVRRLSQGGGGDFCGVMKNRSLRKALLACTGLMVFQQLTGITVVIFYMQSIFMSSGSRVSPEISAIVVGVTQTMGCALASTIVEKLGRKFLLLLSACGVALTLSILAAYFYMKAEADASVAALFWLPVTCIITYIAAFNIGYGPMPFTILGEVFPPGVKSLATTWTVSVGLLLGFCTTKFFPGLVGLVGTHYSFWMFSACTLLGVAFIYGLLPETKGKSLQEILDELDGKK